MEAGGVYQASRHGGHRNYPLLCVRGISDIVGFRRAPEWTNYACNTGAAFVRALIEHGIVLFKLDQDHDRPPETNQPRVEILLSSNIYETTETTNPGTLLNARYQVVPFLEDGREKELSLLEQWCGETDPTSVRLFVGPGGTGKTRLFIEWSKRLRNQGWNAGFAPASLDEEQVCSLLALEKPTFVVVDYAECRPDFRCS